MSPADIHDYARRCESERGKFIDLRTAADIVRISHSKIYPMSSLGELDGVVAKSGRVVRLPTASFIQWFLQNYLTRKVAYPA